MRIGDDKTNSKRYEFEMNWGESWAQKMDKPHLALVWQLLLRSLVAIGGRCVQSRGHELRWLPGSLFGSSLQMSAQSVTCVLGVMTAQSVSGVGSSVCEVWRLNVARSRQTKPKQISPETLRRFNPAAELIRSGSSSAGVGSGVCDVRRLNAAWPEPGLTSSLFTSFFLSASLAATLVAPRRSSAACLSRCCSPGSLGFLAAPW